MPFEGSVIRPKMYNLILEMHRPAAPRKVFQANPVQVKRRRSTAPPLSVSRHGLSIDWLSGIIQITDMHINILITLSFRMSEM